MQVHHIEQKADEGADEPDNGIPLCLDCHAEVKAYNPRHPIGRNFSVSELKRLRDNWFRSVAAQEIKEETLKTFLSKLPTTTGQLFGREKELGWLDHAWDDEHTHIIMLHAFGGVGKTSLVSHWLSHMEHDNYRGAVSVYGWSFYSQGTSEDRQASADEFLAHALKWSGLQEASEVAEPEMRLHLADYHLEATRLSHAERKDDQAREHLVTAKKMVEEMGYGRRKPEVEELEKLLGEA
jgi:hypothetical protein